MRGVDAALRHFDLCRINFSGGRKLALVMSRTVVEGSDLYRRSMTYYEEHDSDPALQHKVWDATPWMVNAYTGSMTEDRDTEMRLWCFEQFGDEAWPIHGKPGNWHRGGATIYGWTWFGFATERMMNEFIAAWPIPDGIAVTEAA